MRRNHGRLVGLILATALLAPSGAAAISNCTSLKYKVAGKAAFAKAKCHASAVAKGTVVDAECLARAEQKFTLVWDRAERKADCVTTGDRIAAQSEIDAFVGELVDTLEPPVSTAICCATGDGCYHGIETESDCELLFGTVGTAGTVCDGTTGTCELPPVGTGQCCFVPSVGVCLGGPSLNLAGCVQAGGLDYPFGATCLPDGTCDAPVP